jgi:hypothetical protein
LNELQKIDLLGCSKLEELPSSIGQLNALQKLNLQRYSQLEGLPSSIDHLNHSYDILGARMLWKPKEARI